MTDHLKEYSTLLQAMAQGNLVLTPNHRTHIQLLDFYGQWRQQQKLPSVCLTPQVFPVDIWIRRQWQQIIVTTMDSRKQILEPMLESSVWQDIIAQSDSGAALVNKQGTARSAQEAWRLIHIWKISLADVRRQSHFHNAINSAANNADDLSAFLSWIDSFEKFCDTHGLISLSELVGQVIEKITEGKIRVPENIVLAGFQMPPPLYSDLISSLKNNSKNLQHFTPARHKPEQKIIPCFDAEDEIQKAARWAKGILAKNPSAKIAIINPKINQQAASLQRLFSSVFSVDDTVSLTSRDNKTISLSLQNPLQEMPVIETALGALGLNSRWLDTLSFCKLLRSPFLIFSDTEESACAALEINLRDKGELKIQLSLVRELSGREGRAEFSPLLSSSLLTLDTLRRAVPAKAPCTQWCDVFEAQLQCLGWPGTRELNHAETQQLKAWSRALKLFKQTSHWHGRVSIDSALSHLGQIIRALSANSGTDAAPVQVLNPTEADGLHFTHCWVMGLSEQHWPATAHASPFIPRALQKAAGIPESDINVLTTLAKQQLQQYSDNTQSHIVFSFPCQDDELSLKPSAMLESLTGLVPAEDKPAALAPLSDPAMAMLEADSTELFCDNATVPLSDNEYSNGGVSLLAHQADCPFKAFAMHRLGATPLPRPAIGLPAHVLGSLLHEIMERFWQQIKTQQGLLDASTQTIEDMTFRIVNAALQDKARHYRHTMTEEFIALESQRLSTLLFSWLEEEKKRGSFKVLSSEARYVWQHANLSLNLRVDRLDETAAGTLVVVDYKSSKNSEIKWTDERQTDPQLMLYMQAVEAEQAQQVDGLFIAQIHVEESRYKGISNDDIIYPKSRFNNKSTIAEDSSWDNLRQFWQQSLTAVANEYLQGFAAVGPKQISSSCSWCHLDGLCRINDEVQV